jgi:hypothetical protein
MGGQSLRQTARRVALDAHAGHRRERQERDRRIDALAVEALVGIGERDAVYAGPLLQTRLTANTITIRSATRLLQLAQPDKKESGSGDHRRVDLAELAALDRVLAHPTNLRPVPVQDRQRARR